MCDQTEVQYLPGEVVWVKLRALWWPGLVQDYDSLPEEITCSLRKRPIATVKFFQEDSYEYVHKLDLIYHYNCSRKHEFIKKGLDLCRKKTADRPATMDFFPMDIVAAEEMTDGDPNILQDTAFQPEEKPKYTSLFGEKKKFGKKKGREDSPLKDKAARRKKLTSKLQAMGWLSRGITANIIYPSPDTPRIVTHRRFLNKARNPDGKSDYEVRIMEQKREDDIISFEEKEYQCVICGYVTHRLNVIVLHFNSTHSRRTKNIFPTPSILKGGCFRNPLLKLRESLKSESGKSGLFSKKRMSGKAKSDKVKHKESEVDSSEEETPKPQPVKKEKGKPGRKRKVKPEEKVEEEIKEVIKKPKVLDSLLADWEEDAEQEKEELEREKNRKDEEEDEIDDAVDNDDVRDGDHNASMSPDNETAGKLSVSFDTSSASKSKEVFEFDPDEDDNIDFDLTPNVKGFGRRIPRVIESSKDKKRKGSDSKKPAKEKSCKQDKEDDIDFESLLAETSVPSLPSVPKSSNFSLDGSELDAKSGDESIPKPVLKEQKEASNKSAEESAKHVGKAEKLKNSKPEKGLAMGSSISAQDRKETNTAKVTVQIIPDVEAARTDIIVGEALSSNDLPLNEGKPVQATSGGDHTYVGGNAGRKRRRSLLPLVKNEGSLDIMSLPVVLDDDFLFQDDPPRANKQPFSPKLQGSHIVHKQTPRRVGRPPKKGGVGSRGGKGSKARKSPPQQSPKSPKPHQSSKSSSPHLSPRSPPPLRGSKSPSPHPVSMSPPPAPGPKSPPQHLSPKSPPAHRSPKSPAPEQSPKSPEQNPRSPSHRQSSKSPAHHSPKRQSQDRPIQLATSPETNRGPKSPPPIHSPKSPRSPQPYQSPSHQSPLSPQGLQSTKSPLGLQSPKSPQGFQSPKSPSIPTLLSPKGPKTPTLFAPDTMVLKSPPRSPIKISGDLQSLKSPVKSPQPSPVLSPTSPSKSTGSKVLSPVSSVSKAGGTVKKIASGAVIVQSKPDLQPEACGIGKILASSASSIASGSSNTVKTIKVAVSGAPGCSPLIVGKAGTPGSQPRKVMIVQGKGGTQKMLVPTEASQQLLSNIGSGKKIMVITKGSVGSSGKLMLTSQQQKILASGGKVTTPSGQVVTSKGTVLSSVAKLVTAKPSTSGGSLGGVELSSEPPALVKTEAKKTYKIITTPQSKGNILLNTSGGQILVPVSSIGASGSGVTTLSGSKQFILPVGANQMKLLNTVGGSGQKVILHMKSSPTKASLASAPKGVQPIIPKSVQSISPKSIQTLSPKAVQSVAAKTVQSVTPMSVLPITPKTSQPMKVTKITTMVQPVPQLTPIGAPKTPRPKQVKATVVKQGKSPAQPKLPRKGGASAKAIAASAAATSSSVVLQGSTPQKRISGIVPNPNLKTIAPQATPAKKISLAAKPSPIETPIVSSVPGTMQVMTNAVPGLEPIQSTLVPSVETSNSLTLPTSSQQFVAVQSEDGGQVMYLIDNSSLIGLDNANQANLGNIILAFDNMGQPTSSSASSDFTFSTPSSGQDILAEALANTQVLQSDASGVELGLDTSGLLSSHTTSSMYQPSLSHGVLETSLTINQPIMTPLEDLSAVSSLQPPPSVGAATSIDLPTTITVPDITISTSSYASLPIPSATIQSTVFSEAQNVSTFSTTAPGDSSVFIETPNVEGDSFLTTDSVYEQTSEGASMPLLDG